MINEILYGDDKLVLNQSLYCDQVLTLGTQDFIGQDDIRLALENPINRLPLKEDLITKKPKSVAIVVEDKTRKNPEYPLILDEVITTIQATGAQIYLIIAYGTHGHHTDQESIDLYGKKNLDRVTLIHHDCHDLEKLSHVKDNLYINKYANEADYLMVIGSVKPHAFAGYTGGRKAILPGIASYQAIRNNHSMVGEKNVQIGCLRGNPIHEDMTANANLVNIDMSIQMVKDASGNLFSYFVGDNQRAFEEGTKLSQKLCGIIIKEKFDVVIASVGGAPKDCSIYQSQRALTNAVSAVKEDGLIFLVGEMKNGIGNSIFEEWLQKPLEEVCNLSRSQIDIGIHSAFLTAKNFEKCQKVYLYSSKGSDWSKKYHFDYLEDLSDIKDIVENKYGTNYTSAFIADASSVMIKSKEA